MDKQITWDQLSWLDRFNQRSSEPNHFRSLRREVWQNTLQIFQAGSYQSISGKKLDLDREAITKAQQAARFYEDSREIIIRPDQPQWETRVSVLGADCLETSRLLQLAGFHPAVLNMADTHNPGGAVSSGSGAQEENLFRRSTALASLYQYVDFGQQYGIPRNAAHSYPIPEESGGIYAPGLIVFRSSEQTGYHLLDEPYELHMITVAACAYPPLEKAAGKLRIAAGVIEPSKEKIRAILRLGRAHGHDALVLSAFGCGAFANPPEHMAELFKAVFAEAEFSHAFRLIVFAIIDDHHSHREHNPQGNLLPFQLVFNR